jgi:hypothetical protein
VKITLTEENIKNLIKEHYSNVIPNSSVSILIEENNITCEIIEMEHQNKIGFADNLVS